MTNWSRELGRPIDLRLLLKEPGTSEELDTLLDYGHQDKGTGGPIDFVRGGVPLSEPGHPVEAASGGKELGFWKRLFGGRS